MAWAITAAHAKVPVNDARTILGPLGFNIRCHTVARGNYMQSHNPSTEDEVA
jgi:hypothetical protein